MASRNDLTFEYASSPRVAEIASPSVEIIMQDLVDTFRDAEYSWQGLSFKKLLNASGKEDLGGGVKVGITASLQNTLVAFEGRTTPAETGTVTSNPGSLVTGRDSFIDTAAFFLVNNVARGSLVVNFTDQSIAEVVSVDAEDTLTTKTLVNGIGNTYDVADVYHVFNVIQCIATAGNLTAVDDLQASISAVLPTAFTQVVIEKSSSATIVESGVSGLTPTESTQLAQIVTLRKLMQNRMETNPITGEMTIYDDDDTTPFLTGNIYEDVLADQLYRGRGMERRNRLT